MTLFNKTMPLSTWKFAGLAILAIFVLAVFSGPVAAQSSGTPMIVTTFEDVVDRTDGQCSLREAVIATNRNRAAGSTAGECRPERRGADTILLPVGTYELTKTGRRLEGRAASGDLDIYSHVTIMPQEPGLVVIKGTYANDRVFEVAYGNVTLRNLTISGGSSNTIGGGILNRRANLLLENVTLTGNEAAWSGGGLYNFTGSSKLVNTTVSGNEARSATGLRRLSGKINMINSMIVDDSCHGRLDARSGAGINLKWNASGCSSAVFGIDANPQLTPQLEGGSAVLFEIPTGSPAADVADAGLCPSADQIGTSRPRRHRLRYRRL